jgi:malate dehydrogenase (oxaloacetate-decarboxylating)(NADP+)
MVAGVVSLTRVSPLNVLQSPALHALLSNVERLAQNKIGGRPTVAAGDLLMPTNAAPNLDKTLEKRVELRRSALEYHEFPTPGKIAIAATKQLVNQRDLALAYSPGVAAPCEEIVKDPNNAFKYTSRGNLVAVVTNGTAVLGLGDIGPLASKPVMEGKAVLFKKFAGVDVFDIEIDHCLA